MGAARDDSDPFYFRQLLSGRDFAPGNAVARQMVNFSYALGDRSTRRALLVDPAHSVGDLLQALDRDGMECAGVVATHYHADHVGGALGGWQVEGIAALLDRIDVPVHVQRAELDWVVRATGVGAEHLVAHESGDVVQAGSFEIRLIHTPGHTPGSQCILVETRLVTGDTLFLQGCGRTDLPGGDAAALYESLTTRLAAVPDETVVYPGHLYAPEPSASMGDTRRTNSVFRPRSEAEWLAVFGR